MLEITPLLEGIAYYRKRLKKLVKEERRHVPLLLAPAKVSVLYQPLGVVGIVVPWNFPVFLALSPLIGAIAAGNRVMLKMSEFAPRTGLLLQRIFADIYEENEVVAVAGDVDVATAFTALPFDHLVFTGSTTVGKIVMQAAAKNLTPVTLELGGNSPAIIFDQFPIEEAADRIAFGKGLNAGQVCVSPDYVLCPNDKVEAFSAEFVKRIAVAYPDLMENADYTEIITDRQHQRLQGYLADAAEKGARLIVINPNDEDFSESKKMRMTLVIGATDDMLVMQEEIFGPILPAVGYDTLDNAVGFVNERPRPLALYYFDWDQKRAKQVLERTHSGGVCINDTMSHVIADDIPFGGVGPSGMGHYHGREGFLTFSKAKGVVRKGRINSISFIAPLWRNVIYQMLMKLNGLRFWRLKVAQV